MLCVYMCEHGLTWGDGRGEDRAGWIKVQLLNGYKSLLTSLLSLPQHSSHLLPPLLPSVLPLVSVS